LNPLIPHQDDGNRIDPPVSVPIAKRQDPEATLAAAPEDAISYDHNATIERKKNALENNCH
jgi:hypothetical protein